MTKIYKVHVPVYSYLGSVNIVYQYLNSQNFALIANREDHDQTASPEAVWSRSALFVFVFWQATSV